MKLFNHQETMLERFVKQPYCINGSEAGTGKTYPAIKFFEDHLAGQKGVVFAPAFLTRNWAYEIDKVSKLTWRIFEGQQIINEDVDVMIIPYSRLLSAKDKIQRYMLKLDVKAIVADESHYLNNPKAKRTKAFHSLIKATQVKHLKLMSGTQMRNKIPELWSSLVLMDYHYKLGFIDKYPTQFYFSEHFCNVEELNFGGNRIRKYSGIVNRPELAIWLKPYYFRFKLSDVQDLPELTHSKSYCSADFAVDIDRELRKAWEEGLGSEHIARVKATNAEVKMKHTANVIKHEMEAGNGPLVVFSDHVKPMKTFKLKGYKIANITGSTPMIERERIVREFQAGRLDILLGTIGAMGTGITLTRASVAIFNDYSWVPADNMQAEKRIHRMSQERACRIITVVRPGIDNLIIDSLQKKMKIINQIL